MNQRRKGHDYERTTAKFFRERNFPKVKTTRETSKLLDDCKVDLDFLPFLVQCKSGYIKCRPKYEELKRESLSLIKKHFPTEDAEKLLNKPYLLFHKLGKDQMVTMDIEGFDFFLNCYNFKKEYENVVINNNK